MANVIILHGTGCAPEFFWYSWLKEELETQGHTVWLPQLPFAHEAHLRDWLPFVLEKGHFDAQTILVGHSAGSPLILSVLEHIDVKIAKAILVAGFIDTVPSNTLQEHYDVSKIRANCCEFIFLNSDNDPWGCDAVQGQKLFALFGGTLIIRHGEGHMGSITHNQPYKTFPLLLKLIE
jgi:uncharacterized protein